MADHQVGIIGGGLAGLNAARILASKNVDVALFEREDTVGGRVRTDDDAGYRFDRGFQVLFTAYPEARRALDMSALDLQRFPAGAVVCRDNHRSVVADPLRDPWKAVETAFSRDLSIRDKIEILRLRRHLADRSRDDIFAGPDTSIEQYLEDRGFSRRFVDSFATPFFGGITLDRTLTSSKRIFEFAFSMLASGDAAVPADGMGAIPEQLRENARNAGARIETGTPVDSIQGEDTVEISTATETISFECGIVAAGPEASRELTGIEAIPTKGRSSVTQYFSLPTGNPIGDQSRILLNAGSSVPNQVSVISATAPSYAPEDFHLLSVSTPGHVDVDEERLARQTRTTLSSWYPAASFDDLSLLKTDRIPFAQFDQPPGVHESLPDVTDPAGNVYLAGDFTEDSSINGALSSGRRAATAVESALE